MIKATFVDCLLDLAKVDELSIRHGCTVVNVPCLVLQGCVDAVGPRLHCLHLTLKRVDCSIERWHIHQSGAVTGSMVDGRFASGVPPLRPVRRTGVDGGAGSELIGVTDGIMADADEGRAGATRASTQGSFLNFPIRRSY